MGVIKRQGIKQTLVTYIGIVIGAVNLLYIYPKYLTEDEFGIIRFVNAAVGLALPFVMLGSASLVVRYFPNFKNEEKGHNGWLGFNMLLILTGFVIFLLFVFLFEDTIYEFYSDKPALYLEYLPYTLPFVLCMAILNILGRYCSNFYRIVIPPIFSNLLLKVALPTFVVIYAFDIISFNNLFQATALTYLVAVIATFVYIRYLKQFFLKLNFAAYTQKLRKEMFTFGTYAFFGGMSSIIATQIDILMVGNITNLQKVATYTIAYFISDVIDVPRRALEGISSPLLSEAFKNNDQAKIKELYEKTALTQFVAGLIIFICIWASIDDLFEIIPNGEKYIEGKYVVLILGIGTLIDQATGINTFVIGYSRFFRFNFWLIVLMAFINIGNNLLFIPIFSVLGAAIATMLSKFIYNFSKTLFVWKRLKMHPFSFKFITVLSFGLLAYWVGYLMPSFSANMFTLILGVALRSGVMVSIFVGGVYYFKVSNDINNMIDNALKMVRIGK